MASRHVYSRALSDGRRPVTKRGYGSGTRLLFSRSFGCCLQGQTTGHLIRGAKAGPPINGDKLPETATTSLPSPVPSRALIRLARAATVRA
ncbi:hypothetical protein MRX96_031149 [Rhipicephalus microplus]